MDLPPKLHKHQKNQQQRSELDWLKDFSESIGVPDCTSFAELTELSQLLHTVKPPLSAKYLTSKKLLHLKKRATQLSIAYADSKHILFNDEDLSEGLIRQGLVQFVCGYYDLDFRDVAHYGHANLLRTADQTDLVKKVMRDAHRGDLVGIMMTEPRGGSHLKSMTTVGSETVDGMIISGEKCWISRYAESRYMIIVYQNLKNACIEAAIIDKNDQEIKGLSFTRSIPIGLKGWSWGKITLQNVYVPHSHILHFSAIDTSLRTHFAYYRLMVILLVLGATAKVLDCTLARLQERLKIGDIKHVRDSHLEALATAHAVIYEGFSAVISLLPQYIKTTASKNCIDVSASLKAHVIHNACSSIETLSQMHGAAGFDSAGVVSKTLLDARGFIFADGIQSELLRSVGKSMIMRK